MDRFTRRLALASAAHPWRTITGWILVLGAVFVAAAAGGGTFADDFSAPGSQSARAMELLERDFPDAAKGSALVVLEAGDGSTLAARPAEVESVLDQVRGLEHVAAVADPFRAGTVSADGRIGYAVLTLDVPEREMGKPAFTELAAGVTGTDADAAHLRVELGGDAVFLNSEDDSTGHVGIGLLVALVVLLVVFGTVVAALVPIGLSLVAVAAGIGGITLLASGMEVSVSAIPVSALVGLGVGVDYALFVIARYRDDRAAGHDNRTALAHAMGTSGAAVLFAGGTVVVATSALAITGLGVLTSIGLSTALMVLAAVATALTLLPALLTVLGDRVDTGRVVRRPRSARRPEETAWWRFGHRVSARPWPYLVGATVALLAAATPALGMQTAFPAAGDAPAQTTHRQAYDLLTEGFGEGVNAPLLLVAELDAPGVGDTGLPALAAELATVPGIVSVSEPRLSESRDTAVLTATPATGPADPDTSATIARVRDAVPANVHVSGITAVTDDLNAQLRDTLPLFVGAVVGVSFLLLVLVFRSIVVPLKAAVMNLLSLGVAYGVLVAVFQWGWGAGLLGLEGPTPITSIIVVIMFPILFGLSMDYEVFLLSRIREERDRTGDDTESVARGLAATGRVVTSAALIMIVVFASFVTSPVPSLKMLGLGLAVAVLVDATVVRMVLVPATMALLGRANWWLPGWLEHRLPRLTVEGAPVPEVSDRRTPRGAHR
jgi:RND superfamily putative drug exporter